MSSPLRRLVPQSQDSHRLTLPTHHDGKNSGAWGKGIARRGFMPKRYLRILTFFLFALLIWVFFGQNTVLSARLKALVTGGNPAGRLPPTFDDFREQEAKLPQHSLDAPYPNGKHAKFIYHANHASGSGWGNVMQEMLFNAVLAHASGRAFVFDNYTWDHNSQFSTYNGNLIPSKVPLSALAYGPIVGAPFGGKDNEVPYAVSRKYYESQCPNPTLISVANVTDLADDASGMTRLRAWVKKIDSMTDKCIEFETETAQPFGYLLLGSKVVLDVWPAFVQSPMIANYTWSPLVLAAFQRNAHHFFSPGSKPTSHSYLSRPQILSAVVPTKNYTLPVRPAPNDITLPALIQTPPAPLPGVLAMHIRKGDYENHCNHLAKWSSTFTGFNSFEEFPDHFEVPAGGSWGDNTPENFAYYKKRCFPSIEEIVEKTRVVRKEHRERGGQNNVLRRIYVMTNGKREWVAELKKAMYEEFGDGPEGLDKDGVVSSRDLELDWEQKFVSQAMDMYVGQRAEVFIGNGWSSLSGNVDMLRMVNGKDPHTMRHF